MADRPKYHAEFEQLGVDDVRKRVKFVTWDAEKLGCAREWLDEQDHGEERASRRESNQIARSAKNAAWIAAIAAIVAAIAAAVAIIISLGWKPFSF